MTNKPDSHHIVPSPDGGWDVKRTEQLAAAVTRTGNRML